MYILNKRKTNTTRMTYVSYNKVWWKEWFNKIQDNTKSYKVMQRKVMPCNCQGETRTKTPLIKSDVRSTSQAGTTPPQKKHKQTTYGLPSGRHVGGPQWQATPPDFETEFRRKTKQNFQGSFSDEVLYGSGLEFRRATQGREGGRKGWGLEKGRMRMSRKPRT
jgi:hypothetical protein